MSDIPLKALAVSKYEVLLALVLLVSVLVRSMS